MTPTITIITPTFGRKSILSAIESVYPQLQEGDEYIIVGDGPVPFARVVCAAIPRLRYLETPEHTGDFGCTPCDYAIPRATGKFIMFLGDDDRLTADALALVRAGVRRGPLSPHIFSMWHTGRLLHDSVECGHVSGQQIVLPNRYGIPKMARFEANKLLVSDWVFIQNVIRVFGDPVYHAGVVCVLDRQNFGAPDV
jgi:glycosyltransferase involved in cell wall biosynthesis